MTTAPRFVTTDARGVENLSDISLSSARGCRLRSEADLDITAVDHERVDGADGDHRHASDHAGRHAGPDASERLIEPDGPGGRVRRGHAEGHPRVPVQPLAEAAGIQADVVLRLESH